VVEEVWTAGDVVVDETIVVVPGEDGESAAIVIDEVVTDAEGHVEEVVVVEEIELEAQVGDGADETETEAVVEDEA
jgi:hypothetical protein